jgi:hypothetical protein
MKTRAYLVGEHVPVIAKDGDDKLHGFDSDIKLFVQGHSHNAILIENILMFSNINNFMDKAE